MIRKSVSLNVIGAVALAVSGCSLPPAREQTSLASTPSLTAPPERPADSDMAHLIYLAAQTLGEHAESLAKKRPIVVTTIVSVDDLNRSSTFGRLTAQLVANRLEQRGYLVRDVTYTRALALEPKTGEIVLSREASKVSASINAQAVVAGTYAVAGKEIYLNLRLLSAESGELLSSADVVVPLDENTLPLVASAAAHEQLETLEQFEARTGE